MDLGGGVYAHQAHNQYPLGFHQPIYHQGHQALLAPAYQAPTQAPACSSQSTLEDTLKAIMQPTGQSINDVKNATMVNTQAITNMETQIGQIASHLGERERKESSLASPCPTRSCSSMGEVHQMLCKGRSMCKPLSHLGLEDKWTTKWFFLKRTMLHKKSKEVAAQRREMRSHLYPLLRFPKVI
jgi:hypothetical protein